MFPPSHGEKWLRQRNCFKASRHSSECVSGISNFAIASTTFVIKGAPSVPPTGTSRPCDSPRELHTLHGISVQLQRKDIQVYSLRGHTSHAKPVENKHSTKPHTPSRGPGPSPTTPPCDLINQPFHVTTDAGDLQILSNERQFCDDHVTAGFATDNTVDMMDDCTVPDSRVVYPLEAACTANSIQYQNITANCAIA